MVVEIPKKQDEDVVSLENKGSENTSGDIRLNMELIVSPLSITAELNK